jgi:chemosensory pili system protein ChpC
MNQVVEKAELLPDRISCLVLPLVGQRLLVPLTAIAEVVTTGLSPVGGNSDGLFYGWINWREQRIPLISLEVLSGSGRPPLAEFNRIAVFNAVGDLATLGFYGIRLDATPQPVHVTAQTVLAQSDDKQILRIMEAVVGDQQVWLPDMDAVETKVAELTDP